MVITFFFFFLELLTMENKDLSLMKKPFIGFEPMTYALPWRYSTTELKGPVYSILKIK